MEIFVVIICMIIVICLIISMYVSYKHDKVRFLSIDIDELQAENNKIKKELTELKTTVQTLKINNEITYKLINHLVKIVLLTTEEGDKNENGDY